MSYYVIYADGKNDIVITDSEEKAIKTYDTLVDTYPEFEALHFSTWEKEDPEGYDEECPIEDFAEDFIYVDKYDTMEEVIEFLREYSEVPEDEE